MRSINKIIIHCTDSPDSLDIGFKDINAWHKENGWISKTSCVSCGYHYIVKRNGKVEVGRMEEEVGAHCYRHNKRSIGVVWVGRKDIDSKQYKTLKRLVRQLIDKYGLRPDDVYAHKELDYRDTKKTCPNLDMNKFRGDVLFTQGSDNV